MSSTFALYIHVPFCRKKCPYCDFATDAVAIIPEQEYVDALLFELDFWSVQKSWSHRTIHSIFFGGGTPSLLSSRSIERLLSTIKSFFPLTEDCEITLEVNPGTITPLWLQEIFSFGANRLSLGAQTFSPSLLKRLGRDHTPEEIKAAVALSKKAGFSNISIDLMYGCPDQLAADHIQDLGQALSLGISHLSLYSLTLEKGTPYFQAHEKGDLILPHEDEVYLMMQEGNTLLMSQGFKRYESSNYALENYESRHNMSYWSGEDYLGLGPGAHSFLRNENKSEGTRWANRVALSDYWTDTAMSGHSQAWTEFLSPQKMMSEFFLLGLRCLKGVDINHFREIFNSEPEKYFKGIFEELISLHLIERNDDIITLSPKGLLFSDSVGQYFL